MLPALALPLANTCRNVMNVFHHQDSRTVFPLLC